MRRQPRPERRLAGVEERERRRPKPTRATQRESTGNEAARVRRRLPAPPLSFSTENKVPSRATAPAPTQDVTSPLRLRVFCACAGASRLRSFLFFSFPRDSALAVHVSPPPLPHTQAEGAGAVECLCLRAGPRSVGLRTCYSWATPPPTAELRELPGKTERNRGTAPPLLGTRRGEKRVRAL